MTIRYDIPCFERELIIIFPNGYTALKKEIIQMLDEYHDEWHNPESIKDPEERIYVLDSCLEEYMMDRLSETYNMWNEWASRYYGNNPDEMEEKTYWIKNDR